MLFLNSIVLWGSLAAAGVAVPIIIHLLNRYRHRQVDWAAMELLKRALLIRARRVRLEDVLLLLLRCLALALIALALARPTLPQSRAKLLGAGQRTGAVIAVDCSFSMAHGGAAKRFDRARQRVDEIASTLEPGDPVSLVGMASWPEVLLRNMGYEKLLFGKMRDKAQVLPQGLNLEGALEVIEALVRDTKGAARECYLVTDAQAHTWQGLSEKALAALQSISRHARLFVVSAATEAAENVAITRFDHTLGALRRGSIARYVAEVVNFGRREASGITVTLSADDRVVDRQYIDRLSPGRRRVVRLAYACRSAGDVRLTASLSPDQLLTDNTRHAVAHVHERVKVLCVDGEPSERPFDSETDFLLTAFAPKRTVPDRSLLVQRVSPIGMASQALEEYGMIVLANLGEIRPAQAAALLRYVEGGGGLVVFLGDRVMPAALNRQLTLSAGPLLPAEVESPVGEVSADAQGWPVRAAASGHRLADVIADLPEELLDAARVFRFFHLRPHEHAQVLLSIAGVDRPLLVEKAVGAGKVLLAATSADREWTNLPVHPIYSILLHESLGYLTTQPNERSFIAGRPLVLPLRRNLGAAGRAGEGEALPAKLTVRLPNGEEAEIKVTQGAEAGLAEYAKTNQAGFYEIAQPGQARGVLVAGNVDPAESDVRVLGAAALASGLAKCSARVVGPGEDLRRAIRESRVGRELWRELLLIGIVLLIVEFYLAYRFSRRVASGALRRTAAERERFLFDRAAGA